MTDEEQGRIIGQDSKRYDSQLLNSDGISQLEERVSNIEDRLRRLEGQTPSEDNDRIKAIERRLHRLEATGDPRYGPLVERINLEVERIDAPASEGGWIKEAGVSAHRETDRQLAELFNRAGEATRRLDDLVQRLSEIDALRATSPAKVVWDRALRMSSTEQDVWSAGYAEGKKTTTNLFRRYNPRVFEGGIAEALEEAASRGKRYMSNHFSKATINAIVLEVKNQSPVVMVPAEDAGVWTGPPSPNIFNEPIMPQVKMPRPMDLNDSSMLSPGPYPTRPIKDNPQA